MKRGWGVRELGNIPSSKTFRFDASLMVASNTFADFTKKTKNIEDLVCIPTNKSGPGGYGIIPRNILNFQLATVGRWSKRVRPIL